ncbi:MAG TPA: hypothetical protein VJ396_09360 [Acidiferrobacterales bacterium]|nr:hypothetical protein [Acidiferrobacterales bacterium]
MADHFYGVSLGAKGPADVTFGTSTGGTVIELRVTDATTGLTGDRVELLKAIKAIEEYIEREIAPA